MKTNDNKQVEDSKNQEDMFSKTLNSKFLSLLNEEKRLWLIKNSHIAKSNYLTIFIIIFFIVMGIILNSVDYDFYKFLISSVKVFRGWCFYVDVI